MKDIRLKKRGILYLRDALTTTIGEFMCERVKRRSNNEYTEEKLLIYIISISICNQIKLLEIYFVCCVSLLLFTKQHI
jgi:hypothetical protein